VGPGLGPKKPSLKIRHVIEFLVFQKLFFPFFLVKFLYRVAEICEADPRVLIILMIFEDFEDFLDFSGFFKDFFWFLIRFFQHFFELFALDSTQCSVQNGSTPQG
jgi:hypothetical protein